MTSSSVTSRMRPGQLAARGRSSRSICTIGSLTKADAGTLTESFTVAPKRRAVLEVPQRGEDDAFGQRQHVLFLGAGKKAAGTDQAAVGPPRAHQRLGADQALRAQIDLGLVPLLEPVLPQNLAEGDLGPVGFRLGRLRSEQFVQRLQHAHLPQRRRTAGVFLAGR